jgi:hypothetical protein
MMGRSVISTKKHKHGVSQNFKKMLTCKTRPPNLQKRREKRGKKEKGRRRGDIMTRFSDMMSFPGSTPVSFVN